MPLGESAPRIDADAEPRGTHRYPSDLRPDRALWVAPAPVDGFRRPSRGCRR
ncbi:hypothetical protein BKA01_000890 [Pseudonocardia eucalypti]|nr:hypothetical protein [Pseudonocardia eucalypti]